MEPLSLPEGAELLDVEGIPVALLLDRSALAFDTDPPRAFNAAVARWNGGLASPEEFAELAAAKRSAKAKASE